MSLDSIRLDGPRPLNATLEIFKSRQTSPIAQKPKAQPKQLSFWPEELFKLPNNVRASPNDIIRTAIFTIRNKREERLSIQNKKIFALNDFEISFTGIELSVQDDELVWLQIIELAKHEEAETWVNFTSNQLCKSIGWGANGTYYQKIHDCLLRLKATAIQIRKVSEKKGRAFSMISDYEWCEAHFRVKIPAGIQTLFVNNEFSYLQWQQYRKLTPIAKKLYAYAISHKPRPYPLKLETVKSLCDSQVKDIYKWRQQVKQACLELEEAKLLRIAEVRKGESSELVYFKR